MIISQTDLSVSPFCFGSAGLGTTVKGEQAETLLGDYITAGGNFVDTAHCYAFWEPDGLGASEREVGRVLNSLKCRDQVVIATKGGHPDNGPKYRRPSDFLSASVIASDIEDSMERLGVDAIDLYYLHRDDGHTPAGEIIERLNDHVRAGKIRYLGASNWSTARIQEANDYAAQKGLPGFVASQVQWSLATPTWKMGADPTTRFVDTETAAFHAKTGLLVVPYSATAGGYFARSEGGSKDYDTPENTVRRNRAREIAHQIGATTTQVALAWLRHHPFPVVPAFSTGNRDHLQEVLQASNIALTPEQSVYLEGKDT